MGEVLAPYEPRVMRGLVRQSTCAVVFLDADLRILWIAAADRRLTGDELD